ncbi:ankyrin repeat domain-containing protein [Lignipirellula cremea]|uniref:Ankyrin repeats (3 copies) n=1 Tax=Lignipirellula cremea TaxID=2528010 RepID=A0A518DY19_9BACT|nr:hypothetical protein [Lignipirellula cremea]QDU96743.1 Ankyrin repeats (3 copies) [Lignipirellula cremea]
MSRLTVPIHSAAIVGLLLVSAPLPAGEIDIFAAIKADDLEQIKTYIERDGDLDVRHETGATPLTMCISHQCREAYQLLLENGADPDQVVPPLVGGSCLHFAVCVEDVYWLELALKHGGNPDLTARVGEFPVEPLLVTAIRHYSLANLNLLLQNGADPNACAADGEPAASFAAAVVFLDGVEALLDQGADPAAKGRQGQNLGHWMARYAKGILNKDLVGVRDRIMARLKARGIKVERQKPQASAYFDDDRLAKLMAAIDAEDLATIEALVQGGANPDAQGLEGMTPLRWSIQREYWESYQKLLKLGADVNQVCGRMSAIHDAAWMEDSKWLRAAIENGGDVDLHPQYGDPVIIAAISSREVANVELMIESGADVNALSIRKSSTVLTAIDLRHSDMAYLLLQAGAKPADIPLCRRLIPGRLMERNPKEVELKKLVDDWLIKLESAMPKADQP